MRTTEYKPTFFERHGSDGLLALQAGALGVFVAVMTGAVLLARAGFHWWVIPVAALAGCLSGSGALSLAHAIGGGWVHVAVSGASTPSVNQYSFQDAMVMRGEVDAALASFEAIIAAEPEAITPRTRAAELYVRHRGDHARAAELFRAALQSRVITTGEDLYVTNRLVDLLTGPLDQPGRALVELRRFIDRHPNSPAAAQARQSLATLKARLHTGASRRE